MDGCRLYPKRETTNAARYAAYRVVRNMYYNRRPQALGFKV